MPRDYKLYLRDMVEAAQFIETHTAGLTGENFANNEVLLRAVLHSLIVIGEASRHIPEDIRQKAPGIPWREIAGARDIIVHGYFAVNMPIIWSIIEDEVTELRQQVEKLLQDTDES
jgi:uncharacterized protein with HEPN domain